jgi:hypothetical protein
MQSTTQPDVYWHCAVHVAGDKKPVVVNDLRFADLERTIVRPWHEARPFTVSGKVIRSSEQVESIKITYTPRPRSHYAEVHDAQMHHAGIADMATNRSLIPLSQGEDHTFELLFSGASQSAPPPDTEMVVQLCKRLPQAARILATRSRKGKTPYEITDEYDVQDLLHAVLRAYLKYSVQEDPLPKMAGAKSGRADVSIEEIGVLIEVKYVHGPEDQKRLFEDYSQDLVLYSQWSHLKTLVFLIYNSADLRDAEAFEKLASTQEIGGRRFVVKVVLA